MPIRHRQDRDDDQEDRQKRGWSMSNDETLFCCKCFASSEDSSWGGEVFSGHCCNCGSGGTVIQAYRWAVKMIRENASWVGKRYYPHGEDTNTTEELRLLRKTVPPSHGRTAESQENGTEGWWTVKQPYPGGGWISVSVDAKTRLEALDKACGDLPWFPKEAFNGQE